MKKSLHPPSPCRCHRKPPLLRLVQTIASPRLIHSLPLLVGCRLSVCHWQAEKRLSCVLSSCVAACHAPHCHCLCHRRVRQSTVRHLPCRCNHSAPSTGWRTPHHCRCSAPSTAGRLPQHGLCLCSARPLTERRHHRHCLCHRWIIFLLSHTYLEKITLQNEKKLARYST